MAHIAQTHLQLFRQMRGSGYSAADQALVSNAYQLATQLFANLFRPCGRPFVNHLVGTAAVLVRLKAPIRLVVAGLLHASYQEGDFPSSLEGMTPRKRELVRAVVGGEIEELVAAYTVSSRNMSAMLVSHARFYEMSAEERDVLLMQLANELDDYRDLSANHSANTEERIEVIRKCGREQVEMAERLGHPELGRALGEIYADSSEAAVPAALKSRFSYGYAILPYSCRIRPNIWMRRLGVKIRNRLHRHLGIKLPG